MKWYFASRRSQEDFVRSIIATLKKEGHEIVYDWTDLGSLKPYHENAEQCNKISYDISASLADVDVFVLISDAAGTDMFVELGIVIGYWMKSRKSRIYLVGEHNKRSLMHLHPAIIHMDSLQEVMEKECQNLKESLVG